MIAAGLVSMLLPVVCRVRSTFSGADRDADLLLAIVQALGTRSGATRRCLSQLSN